MRKGVNGKMAIAQDFSGLVGSLTYQCGRNLSLTSIRNLLGLW